MRWSETASDCLLFGICALRMLSRWWLFIVTKFGRCSFQPSSNVARWTVLKLFPSALLCDAWNFAFWLNISNGDTILLLAEWCPGQLTSALRWNCIQQMCLNVLINNNNNNNNNNKQLKPLPLYLRIQRNSCYCLVRRTLGLHCCFERKDRNRCCRMARSGTYSEYRCNGTGLVRPFVWWRGTTKRPSWRETLIQHDSWLLISHYMGLRGLRVPENWLTFVSSHTIIM